MGVWVLVGSLVGTFVLDVTLPGVVLLPFMSVPVVAVATFAGARITGGVTSTTGVLGASTGGGSGFGGGAAGATGTRPGG